MTTFAGDVFSFEYPADWSRMGSKEIRSLDRISDRDYDYLGGVYTGGVNHCPGCAEIVAYVQAVGGVTGTLSAEQYERIREAEEQQMGSRLLLHRLTSAGSLPAIESRFVGRSLESQQWQLIIVPKEPGKVYLFGCSSHKDSWDKFEAVCERAIGSLRIEGSDDSGIVPTAALLNPTRAPTARPARAPTALPTATPGNGCPPDPAIVRRTV